MTNAKQEFLDQIEVRGLLCSEIRLASSDVVTHTFQLKQDYTDQELEQFLTRIDFKYYQGPPYRNLLGFIWHTSNTWSERFDHDGIEWWEFREIPAIPVRLQGTGT